MRKVLRKMLLGLTGAILLPVTLLAQELTNTAGKMMQDEDRLTIGGYGQIDYNQLLDNGSYNNGGLDVHRLVLMFGYKFNAKTQFITEIEVEHVKEVFVEQAFLQYEILPWLKLRGGLMLIPMGIINEYHEPSTFNGVERPNLDKYIVPTTWREIGAGFTGTFPSAALSYQLYLVNGFNGYNEGPTLSGSNGFRKGRQKGAESIIKSPNLSFKINYFGLPGLQLGLSGYTGKTQSSLYKEIEKSDMQSIASADSSLVGLFMLGVDARYQLGGLQVRGQANLGTVSNSASYNEFTGSDLGSSLGGWYLEVSYDLLHNVEMFESGLIPFIRYEQYNTHVSTESPTNVNPEFQRTDLTIGLGWKLAAGAMLKADFQWFSNKGTGDSKTLFNAGVAVWF
ncbi:MAG: hypothetical protein KAI08_15600 [Bacteroidales bacterium]|nr:hypothetical protein [Bacteroidales bacterium]